MAGPKLSLACLARRACLPPIYNFLFSLCQNALLPAKYGSRSAALADCLQNDIDSCSRSGALSCEALPGLCYPLPGSRAYATTKEFHAPLAPLFAPCARTAACLCVKRRTTTTVSKQGKHDPDVAQMQPQENKGVQRTLNHRLSPTWHLRMYRLPLLTDALISW